MELVYFNRTPLGRTIRNLLGSLVLALAFTAIALVDSTSTTKEILISFAWAYAICASQWLGHSYFFTMLDRKFPWDQYPKKRTWLGVITIITYAVLAYMTVSLIMARIVYGALPENPLVWGIRTSFVTILISFGVCLVFLAYGFFISWKQTLLEAERFKSEMLMYKYEALQNQINPHFLFNSFNVLSELVYENREKAVDFIKQLSGLFRYVLDTRDKELVRVSEELDFIRAFAYLLHTRFEEKLDITIEVEAKADEMIVPMTLQMLIENCVKHNEISDQHPLSIKIQRYHNSLSVTNNLQEKKVVEKSTSTGLSNLQQQYSYFTERKIEIKKEENRFQVTVPILSVTET